MGQSPSPFNITILQVNSSSILMKNIFATPNVYAHKHKNALPGFSLFLAHSLSTAIIEFLGSGSQDLCSHPLCRDKR